MAFVRMSLAFVLRLGIAFSASLGFMLYIALDGRDVSEWFNTLFFGYGEVALGVSIIALTGLLYALTGALWHRINAWRDPLYIELKKSRELFRIDPAMAVVRQRITLEKAIRSLLPEEVRHETGPDRDLFNYTKMLFRKRFIPDQFESPVHKIRMLGNRAAHEGEATLEEALWCDQWLTEFLKWCRKGGRRLNIPAEVVRSYLEQNATQTGAS